MRDPNRIDEFCEVLAKAWHKVPDWRFGQLVVNLPYPMDPFFIEDDKMLDLIREYFDLGTDELVDEIDEEIAKLEQELEEESGDAKQKDGD